MLKRIKTNFSIKRVFIWTAIVVLLSILGGGLPSDEDPAVMVGMFIGFLIAGLVFALIIETIVSATEKINQE